MSAPTVLTWYIKNANETGIPTSTQCKTQIESEPLSTQSGVSTNTNRSGSKVASFLQTKPTLIVGSRFVATTTTTITARCVSSTATNVTLIIRNDTTSTDTTYTMTGAIGAQRSQNISVTASNTYTIYFVRQEATTPQDLFVSILAPSKAIFPYLNPFNYAGTNNTFVSSQQNAIFLSGNVGIGTGTPTQKLHVYGTTRFQGNVGIGITAQATKALEVFGDIVASGDVEGFGSVSDARLKKSIQDTPASLPKILQMRPIEYQWNENVFVPEKIDKWDVGFLAQDVATLFPLVTRDLQFPNTDTIYHGIHYEKLVPYLVKAVQELSAQVQQLQSRLDAIDNK